MLVQRLILVNCGQGELTEKFDLRRNAFLADCGLRLADGKVNEVVGDPQIPQITDFIE
jgi:hypothetical protein